MITISENHFHLCHTKYKSRRKNLMHCVSFHAKYQNTYNHSLEQNNTFTTQLQILVLTVKYISKVNTNLKTVT